MSNEKMSNERHETVTDNVSANHQFREVAKMIQHEEVAVSKMETTTPTSEKSSAVGNSAVIRDALEQIHELLSIGGNPDTAMCIRYEAAYQLAEDALSAPPRNCDRQLPAESVSADDVEQAWIAFKLRTPDVYFDVPGLLRFIVWLFAEEKGETDGSK